MKGSRKLFHRSNNFSTGWEFFGRLRINFVYRELFCRSRIFFVDREFDLPQWSPGVTCIGKILITELDRKIAKQSIGISKKPHTVLETNLLKLKLCRSFTCAGRFNTRLIRSKKHRPFRLVAPEMTSFWRISEHAFQFVDWWKNSRLTGNFSIDRKFLDRQKNFSIYRKFLDRQKNSRWVKKFSIDKINSQSTKNFSTTKKNCLTDEKVFSILSNISGLP